jgi:hypothetical protein
MATILIAVFLVRTGEKDPSIGESTVPEEEVV